MPEYGQISVAQEGDIGGQGVSRFNFVGSDGTTVVSDEVFAAATAVHAFYSRINQFFPGSITYAIQPEVPVIDQNTGELLRFEQTDGSQLPITGTAGQADYAAGVGIRVNWQTGVVIKGRRLKGAIYLVPLAGNVWTSDGALNGSIQGAITASASDLINELNGTAGGLVVVHRPAKGTHTGGVVGSVQSQRVGTTPSSLRSRRV